MRSLVHAAMAAVVISMGTAALGAGEGAVGDRLVAPGVTAGDEFGSSVATGGGLAVVGSPRGAGAGADSGVAHVFDSAGAFQITLSATDGDPFDFFGRAVASDGDLVLVGAPGFDGISSDTGAVYVYDAASGALVRRISPDGVIREGAGTALALDGDLVVIGGPGRTNANQSSGTAYVYDVTTGSQLARLTPSVLNTFDVFGSAVGLSGEVAVIGVRDDDGLGSSSGAVFLFDARSGAQIDRLLAPDGISGDALGAAVAIDGSVIAAGAPGRNGAAVDSGAVYVFDSASGAHLETIVASEPAGDRGFGAAVALSGTLLAVGSEDGSPVEVIDLATGERVASASSSGDGSAGEFGGAVALEGERIVVGAGEDDAQGAGAGAAYLFVLGGAPADLDGDGCVGASDLAALIAAWGASGPADLDGDGSVGASDLAALIAAWGGC